MNKLDLNVALKKEAELTKSEAAAMYSRSFCDSLNLDLNLDFLRAVSLRGMVLSSVIILIRIKQRIVSKSSMQRNLRPRLPAAKLTVDKRGSL